LHELSPAELRLTNLITTDRLSEVLPQTERSVPVAQVTAKPMQDRFGSNAADIEAAEPPVKSTKTAEAQVPTGSVAVTAPAQ
jgi:hypothetical protein